jgi:3'-phosphoadenosine 5'-phosphosulfate sulfotransferase (PAPS reductase)/FAD synthetase
VIKHVVSVSGGKDSAATLLLAIERFGVHRVIAIFCDTGNEHSEVYAYLDYLESSLGIKIVRLKASFAFEIARKRMFIARDVRTRRQYATAPRLDANGDIVYRKNNDGSIQLQMVWNRGVMDLEGIPRMRKVRGECVRWTNKAKRRALSVLHPTGNPFLDLCLWKGRFPSRKAQFCTEHLKRNMAVEAGYKVVSWQGIRRDESQNRRFAKEFERVGGGIWIYRPIVHWTAAQVFEHCAAHGLKPNPLYLQDMDRVGCMPCINIS